MWASWILISSFKVNSLSQIYAWMLNKRKWNFHNFFFRKNVFSYFNFCVTSSTEQMFIVVAHAGDITIVLWVVTRSFIYRHFFLFLESFFYLKFKFTCKLVPTFSTSRKKLNVIFFSLLFSILSQFISIFKDAGYLFLDFLVFSFGIFLQNFCFCCLFTFLLLI